LSTTITRLSDRQGKRRRKTKRKTKRTGRQKQREGKKREEGGCLEEEGVGEGLGCLQRNRDVSQKEGKV